MMRRFQVWPDQLLDTRVGQIAVVSRAAQEAAFLDAMVLLDRCGGTIQVVPARAQTDLPGEMVTTALVIEWRHDARVKAGPMQFEQPTQVDPQPTRGDHMADALAAGEAFDATTAQMVGVGEIGPFMAEADARALDLEPDTDPEAAALAEARSDGDDFDYSGFADEDIDGAPAETLK